MLEGAQVGEVDITQRTYCRLLLDRAPSMWVPLSAMNKRVQAANFRGSCIRYEFCHNSKDAERRPGIYMDMQATRNICF